MKQTMKTQRCKQQSFCWLTLAVSLFSNSTAVRGLTAPSTPHIARPAVRLRAVTDPATLLGAARTAIGANTNRNQTVDFYYATDEIPQSPSINLNGDRKKSETIVLATKSASSSIRSRRKAKLLPKKSRSSTMPGYRTKTHNQLSHSKNIAFLEGQTGKDMSFLHESSSRTGGEAMYQTSSSVPDSLVQFARELHQEERITPSEEIELGRLTQEAIKLQSLYDNLELSLDREPTDEEWCAAAGKINMEALRQTLEEGLEAKNKLVTSNLRMVQRVVNIYIRNGLSGQYNAGDLMQEGIMALIRAAEKFEPHRGFRFSTYAMYWIRSAVKRSQTYQSRVITVPQRLHANHKRVITTERELRQDLGRRPTKQELAEAVQMSVESLERCLRAMDQRCYSLDQTIQNRNKPGSESGREDTLIDILDSKTDDGEYAKLSRVFLRQDLTDSLYRHLDRESAHMVLLRFGLVDPDILPQGYEGPLTIAQVGELVGMKPDKVRRKILKSLKDLRFLIGSEWDDYESFLTS